MRDFKSVIKPTLSLFIICLVAAAALAVTNRITEGPIAEKEKQTAAEAMKKVIPADEYTEESVSLDGEDYTYSIAKKGDNTEGYIFTVSGSGYKGKMSLMVGILPDGKVKAVEILDVSNETAGIGQKVAEDDFKNQFSGKQGTFEVGKDIVAISGATISSKGVTGAVNTACRLFDKVKGGAVNE